MGERACGPVWPRRREREKERERACVRESLRGRSKKMSRSASSSCHKSCGSSVSPAAPQRVGGRQRQRQRQRRRESYSCRATSGGDDREVWLLDYGAGNVRSIRNAIKYLGYTVRDVTEPQDLRR